MSLLTDDVDNNLEKPVTLAELLRQYRTAAGMTQEVLAERAQVSTRTISDLERGIKTRPHAYTIRQLAAAMALVPGEEALLVEILRRESRQSRQPAGKLPVGAFLGAAPSLASVGRDMELDRVRQAITAARAGQGRVVFVAGEPGIGKTRLAQDASLEALSCGFLVVTSQCYRSEQGVPFYPFRALMAQLQRNAEPGTQSALARDCPHAVRLLAEDSLDALPAGAGGAAQLERYQLFREVSRFLQIVAGDGPLAILVDDLHFADPSTVDLFLYLARDTRTAPVLLLATYRDSRLQPELHHMLAETTREQAVEHIALHRLEQEDTRALLSVALQDVDVSQDFATLVHSRTEGNPFFTLEVLRELISRGDVYREGDGWTRREIDEIAVPETVRLVVRNRLSYLPPDAQDVLRQAAVLGRAFRFEILMAMAEQPEQTIETALDASLDAGLIQELEDDVYTFDHVLTQETLYTGLSARQRRKLHQLAGSALERTFSTRRSGAEIARHFLRSGDKHHALPYCLLAADQAGAVFAHIEAERHLRMAVQLAQDIGDGAAEAEALKKLGQVLMNLARYDEALEVLERAAQGYRRAEDVQGLAQTTVHIGRVCALRGLPEEGISRLRDLVPALEDGSATRELAAAQTVLAHLYFVAGKYGQVLENALRACATAQAVGDTILVVEAEQWRGTGLAMTGHVHEGLAVLEATAPLAEEAGDLATLSRLLNTLGEIYAMEGRSQESRRVWARALEVAEQQGDPTRIAFMEHKLGYSAYLAGDWTEARQHINQALAGIGDTASWSSPYVHIRAGMLAQDQGDARMAERHFNAAAGLARESGDRQALALVERILAERDIVEGHVESALTRLEPLLYLREPEGEAVTELLPIVAWVKILLGDTDEARELLTRAMRQSEREKDRMSLAQTMRVQAILSASEGHWEDALRQFGAAIDMMRTIGYRFGQARVLYDMAGVYRELGKLELVRDRLNEALSIFRALGAWPSIDRVEHALAQISVQPIGD